MENNVNAASFQQPAPYSLDGYFDIITENTATPEAFKRVRLAYQIPIESILRKINTKSGAERAALLEVLQERLRAYGESKKFLEPEKKPSPSVLADYIIKDVLGLEKKSVTDKTIDEFKSLLTKHLNEQLNARGKSQLKFLKWTSDLVGATTPEERYRVLLAGSQGLLETWLKNNRKLILDAGLRAVGISAVARNRFFRIVALRVAWVETFLARMAWVSPVLLALDLFLTPEEIASDRDEERLGFLGIYTQVGADRRILLSNIIERAPGPEWKFLIEPKLALRAALN